MLLVPSAPNELKPPLVAVEPKVEAPAKPVVADPKAGCVNDPNIFTGVPLPKLRAVDDGAFVVVEPKAAGMLLLLVNGIPPRVPDVEPAVPPVLAPPNIFDEPPAPAPLLAVELNPFVPNPLNPLAVSGLAPNIMLIAAMRANERRSSLRFVLLGGV